MSAYYNEFKPEAAHMLWQLIKDGHIAPGDVDERSITEVSADDVRNYTQCHWFAGIGGWSVALRLAGWDDARPVWTGSCPCQPFSSAGRQKGKEDERHLWPEWFRLIRELRPATVFGEQVESAIAHGWLDDVYDGMEGQGYAVGAAVLPACAVGKPHQRKRLWFVGVSDSARPQQGSEALKAARYGDTTITAGRECGSIMGNAEHDGQSGRQIAGSEGQTILNHAQGTDCTSEFTGASESEHVADTDNQYQRSASTYGAGQGNALGVREVSDVANTVREGLEGHGGYEREHGAERWQEQDGLAGAADIQWLQCPDGKSRPVEPGICLLAHGVQHRAPVLHAFGNAIVPQVAAEFIKAYLG